MKTYGQYCGLGRAAELLGERWTMLIVRDLLVGPKRFNQLRHGIPGIPSNVLTGRLRDLEASGVVERAVDVAAGAARGSGLGPASGASALVYRLTPYGADLGDILLALGRWGARRMDAPRPGEAPTSDSLAVALLSARTDAEIEPFSVQIEAGEAVAHAVVGRTGVRVEAGPLPDADLMLGGAALRRVLAGELAPADAVAAGSLSVGGDERLAERFVRAFHVPLDEEAAVEAAPLTPRR